MQASSLGGWGRAVRMLVVRVFHHHARLIRNERTRVTARSCKNAIKISYAKNNVILRVFS